MSESAQFLLERIKRSPIGEAAAIWTLNIALPIAPSLEESLRIAGQDWDGENVEFYEVHVGSKGKAKGRISLKLSRGRPVHVEGLSDLMFAVHTDEDHRFHWRVTEISTGSAITQAKSSEELAIAATSKMIERYGSDGVHKTLQYARERLIGAFANHLEAPQRLTPTAKGTAAILRQLGVDTEVGAPIEK